MLIWLFSVLIATVVMGVVFAGYSYLSVIYPWTAFFMIVLPMMAVMFIGIVLGVHRLILKVYEGRL